MSNNSGGLKTIKFNPLIFSNSNQSSGNNKTRKVKPPSLGKMNNVKQKLMSKIQQYQNSTQNNKPSIVPKHNNIQTDENDAFKDSLHFFNELSTSKNEHKKNKRNNPNNQHNNNNNNVTLKNKAPLDPNRYLNIATELPPELELGPICSPPKQVLPLSQMLPPPLKQVLPLKQATVSNTMPTQPATKNWNPGQTPTYSNLKQGSLPTYRNWKGTTQKNKHLPSSSEQKPKINIMTDLSSTGTSASSTSTNTSASSTGTSTGTSASSTGTSASSTGTSASSTGTSASSTVSTAANTMTNDVLFDNIITSSSSGREPTKTLDKTDENNNLSSLSSMPNQPSSDPIVTAAPTVVQPPRKTRITRTLKYKLGKHKNGKVSILIKNAQTRRKVQTEYALLKNKGILDIKNYLRSKNLLKAGADAPADVLRQLYEQSILTGQVENKSKDTLIHNFFNDKATA